MGIIKNEDIVFEGSYSDATANVSFGTSRTPNPDKATLVLATVTVYSTGGNIAQIQFDVGGSQKAEVMTAVYSGALASAPDTEERRTASFIVPPGSSYTIRNVADPNTTNSLDSVLEMEA